MWNAEPGSEDVLFFFHQLFKTKGDKFWNYYYHSYYSKLEVNIYNYNTQQFFFWILQSRTKSIFQEFPIAVLLNRTVTKYCNKVVWTGGAQQDHHDFAGNFSCACGLW